MELKLDEQTLLTGYRRLPAEGRKEMQDLVALLVIRYDEKPQKDELQPQNQCALKKPREERPEASPETLVTE